MRELAERAYFLLCLTLGRLLRAGRYSKAWTVCEGGELQVRKRRAFYAPLLVSLGGPLVRVLDTGVRVLPQRLWAEREGTMYERLYGASIRIDGDGTLALPRLAGETLATMLGDVALGDPARRRAIELAVIALARFHALGLTHGDAMAENVMVDLEAGVAHWFDFETIHESRRPVSWRRADDVRALLATCVVRTVPEKIAETVKLVLEGYGDESIVDSLAPSFTAVLRRPLAFHLGQAPLPLRRFREIARLVTAFGSSQPRGDEDRRDRYDADR